MDIKVSEEVQTALVKFNAGHVTPQQFAQHLGFTDRDMYFLKLFQPAVFDKSWVLLDRDMIKEWFCKNDTSAKAANHFIDRVLLKFFVEDIDYKKADENDLEVINSQVPNLVPGKVHTGGSKKQIFWITGECLKAIGMMQNKEIQRYYLKIERLLFQLAEYLMQSQIINISKQMTERLTMTDEARAEGEEKLRKLKELHEAEKKAKDDEIARVNNEKEDAARDAKEREDTLKLQHETEQKEQQKRNNFLHTQNMELLTLKKFNQKAEETIYVGSSRAYALSGISKIGQTKSMKMRSPGHNNTRIGGDKFISIKEFKVHNAHLIEHYIHAKLKGCLINKEVEFFMAPVKDLCEVVQACIDFDNEINNRVDLIVDKISKLSQNGFTINEWISADELKIFGNEAAMPKAEVKKVDIVSATNEEKIKLCKDVINSYMQDILKLEFDINTDEEKKFDSGPVVIKWSDLVKHMKANFVIRGQGNKVKDIEWANLFGVALNGITCIKYKQHSTSRKIITTTTNSSTTVVTVEEVLPTLSDVSDS